MYNYYRSVWGWGVMHSAIACVYWHYWNIITTAKLRHQAKEIGIRFN